MKCCVILTAVANEADTKKLAKLLLSQKLAACVSIIPCRSMYVWREATRDEVEFQLYIKTRLDLYGQVEEQLLAHHPYELPEIICLPLERGYAKYLDWVDAVTERF